MLEEQSKKNEIEEEQAVNLVLKLIADRIVKFVQRIRENELILNNESLRIQYNQDQLELFQHEIKDNWREIRALRQVANMVKAGTYDEEDLK